MRKSGRWLSLAPPIPAPVLVISSVPQSIARVDRAKSRRRPTRADVAPGIFALRGRGTDVLLLTVAGCFGTLMALPSKRGCGDDEIGARTKACRSQSAFVPERCRGDRDSDLRRDCGGASSGRPC